MSQGMLAQLHKCVESMIMKLKIVLSSKEDETATYGNLKSYVHQNELLSACFDISDVADKLNQSHEFRCMQFNKDKNEESWIFQKPLLMLGEECEIQINVTIQYDFNRIVFIMPMYGDGLQGLVGDKVESFYNLMAQFNSRTNGGYFTKYTYDVTNTPVFMHHFPLSRMDVDWFQSTLRYFVEIFSAFRPLFDQAINTLGLKFDEKAGLMDPINDYLEERKKEYILLGGTDINIKH